METRLISTYQLALKNWQAILAVANILPEAAPNRDKKILISGVTIYSLTASH
jgi:hypothetical protein